MSDIYAMGGRPLFALNLVAWNRDELALELLSEVLAGAADVGAEDGWVTAGGHSVDDPEPKFGLAVVGEVDPDLLLRNSGLRDGDALVLSKPLGIGVVTTAIKRQVAPAAVEAAAIAAMVRSNADAAAAALAAGATGATDVTGFGLLGHLRTMASASAVDATIRAGAVPLLPGAYDLAAAGVVPGGSERNLAWALEVTDAPGVDPAVLALLADAQTSGGLLFGVAPDRAEEAVARLRGSGHDAAVIGAVRAGGGRLTVA